MGTYIVRRLVWLPVILLIVSFITFVLGRYGPGDPIQVLMGQHSDPRVVERIREQRGFNDPVLVQYGRYLKNVTRGDFGESIKYRGRTVAELLKKKMWVSAQLNVAALVLSVGLGIPIGVFAAMRQGTLWDTSSVLATLLGQSIPVFLSAPVLLLVFARQFDILPTHGWGGVLRHPHCPAGGGHGCAGHRHHHQVDPRQHPGGHQPRLRSHRPGQRTFGVGRATASHSTKRFDTGGHLPGVLLGGNRVHLVRRRAVFWHPGDREPVY